VRWEISQDILFIGGVGEAKKEKEMKEFIYVFGAPLAVGLVAIVMGLYAAWRERH